MVPGSDPRFFFCFALLFLWYNDIIKLASIVVERGLSMTLKEYRQQCGLTQRDLAMNSGVSVRTIREIENHKRLIGNVTVNTAVRLARIFGITVEDLTGKVFEVNDKIYFENDFKWFKPKEAVE